MEGLNPRSVLVTGCNRGIGLEMIKQLAEKSNPPQWIFATCRDPEGPRTQDLRNLAAQHQEIVIIPLNITDPSSIKSAVTMVTERLSGTGLHLLINNAAVGSTDSKLEFQTPEEMAEVYKTNVIGPMMISQAFLPLLRKASQESPKKGMSCSKASIVNMSSQAGSITDVYLWKYGQVLPYRCSKAALNMLTRCQSLACSEDEILCVTLHPGWVITDMGGSMAEMTAESSVAAILNLLAHLSEKDSGTFLNWEGKVLPW
ncbi:C-factor-like [Crotalus tigris]|uniref:C-factor-like n=1 Tax=Crotalus tigris TaxID=88082 RepID=UPI00192F245C|nr:C-factor-like [Crotalus tigris]XP_039183528.1 C-factor-like [Crotalus tigris]XP_039183529.1 C-factor-like [Crotalus tigris]